MAALFSKSESETLQALLLTCSQIRSQKLNVREAIPKLAASYWTLRQIFFQWVVYYSLSEVWLRKCFPKPISVSNDRLSEYSRFEKR